MKLFDGKDIWFNVLTWVKHVNKILILVQHILFGLFYLDFLALDSWNVSYFWMTKSQEKIKRKQFLLNSIVQLSPYLTKSGFCFWQLTHHSNYNSNPTAAKNRYWCQLWLKNSKMNPWVPKFNVKPKRKFRAKRLISMRLTKPQYISSTRYWKYSGFKWKQRDRMRSPCHFVLYPCDQGKPKNP